MYYYNIYESEAAANAAANALIGSTRKDWKTNTSLNHQVPMGMVAPICRPSTDGSEAVYGFIVQVEGPFARVDEPDRGVARHIHGYAWVAY
jgi:hypothetical protein